MSYSFGIENFKVFIIYNPTKTFKLKFNKVIDSQDPVINDW